jgi:thiosulfate dehydrogenase [quinone] large subunit
MNQKYFAILRILFGAVWAIDASFKWRPSFLYGLIDMLTTMMQAQPTYIQRWISVWIHVVSTHPHVFAIAIACIESLIALFLILGLYTRATIFVGTIFILFIWSIGGCGGPYTTSTTDIGAPIIYVFVFAALWIGNSAAVWSVDAARATIRN